MKNKLIITIILMNLLISILGVYQVSRFNYKSEISIKYTKYVELELENEHNQKIKTDVTSDLFGVDIEYKNEKGKVVYSSRISNETAFLFILIIAINCLVLIFFIYVDFKKMNELVN